MKRYFFLYLIKLVPVDQSFSISSLDCVSNLQPTLINDNWPFHLSDPSEEEDSKRSILF